MKRVWHVRLTIETNDPEDTRDRDPYYEDQEMPRQLREWMDDALSDRSDSPKITWSEFTRCDHPGCLSGGVVDGIRPHRPMTEAEMDQQRRMYEALPKISRQEADRLLEARPVADTGEINVIRGRE